MEGGRQAVAVFHRRLRKEVAASALGRPCGTSLPTRRCAPSPPG